MKILVTGGAERWRNVTGYKGLYKVSDFGRVKSLERTIKCGSGTKIIPEQIKGGAKVARGRGYPTVALYKDNKAEWRAVHRLVLEAFVGPCPPGMECRHFPDRDSNNVELTNLSWGTRSQNNLDKRVHQTNGAVPLVPLVCQYCKNVTMIGKWRSKRKRFCSQDCYHAFPKKHKTKISYDFNCEECKTSFKALAKNRHFCSHSCSALFSWRERKCLAF